MKKLMSRLLVVMLMLGVIVISLKVNVNAEEDNTLVEDSLIEDIQEETESLTDKFNEVVVYLISALMSLGVSGSLILTILKLAKEKLNKVLEKAEETKETSNNINASNRELETQVINLTMDVAKLAIENKELLKTIKIYVVNQKERDKELNELLEDNFKDVKENV